MSASTALDVTDERLVIEPLWSIIEKYRESDPELARVLERTHEELVEMHIAVASRTSIVRSKYPGG